MPSDFTASPPEDRSTAHAVHDLTLAAADRRAVRIRTIAVGLASAGVTASTNGNHLTGLDVTACSQPPGRATAEIMLDEDGYAEIRWFTNPAAPAEEVTAALIRILAAITETPSALAPAPASSDAA